MKDFIKYETIKSADEKDLKNKLKKVDKKLKVIKEKEAEIKLEKAELKKNVESDVIKFNNN